MDKQMKNEFLVKAIWNSMKKPYGYCITHTFEKALEVISDMAKNRVDNCA